MSSNATALELVAGTAVGTNASRSTQAINSLSAGVVSLWQVAHRSVTNFALEHNSCNMTTTPSGTGTSKATFTLSKAGDLCTSVYLEVVCPGLKSSGASEASDLVSYVWGLGYAMIQSAQFKVSNHSQEDLSGDWMEINEELHQPAGRRLRESVFKMDNCTLPDLGRMSRQGFVLYTPIPFWFTKGAHAALPVIAMNCHTMDIDIHLRDLQELTVIFPATMAGTSPIVHSKTTSSALTWGDFKINLWVGQVYLDTAERNSFANNEHQYIMKTVHQYTSHMSQSGTQFPPEAGSTISLNNIPFNHPVVDLVWVIADTARTGKKHNTLPASTATGIPYTAGVRGLYGTMASVSSVSTTTNGVGAANADWNVLREGAVALAPAAAGSIMSSAAVKVHRNDGLNGCLHLAGNRFDYRMATGSEATLTEVEPMHSAKIQFNNNDRVQTTLQPQYFRTVQPNEHFNNTPRKGIYCYSFAQNASSPFPNGTCNFSRIDDKTIEIVKNAAHVASSTAGATETGAELFLFAEYFQIYSVKRGSTGKMFGA